MYIAKTIRKITELSYFRKLNFQLHMMNCIPRVSACQSGIGIKLCETPTLVHGNRIHLPPQTCIYSHNDNTYTHTCSYVYI